jgi:hypothetical protein
LSDCDTQIRNGAVLAIDPTTCNMACNGNSSEICGGGNRLSLYKFGANSVSSSSSSGSSSSSSIAATPSSTSTTSAASSGAASAVPVWSYLGCYVDSVNARTLGNAIYGNANVMTVELCQSSCKSGGYTLSGVEYSGECCKLPDPLFLSNSHVTVPRLRYSSPKCRRPSPGW